MSLLNGSPSRTDASGPRSARSTVRAMGIGQHVMAVGLTAIGAVRAFGDGSSPAAVLGAGLALLAWDALGAMLTSRSRSPSVHRWWLVGFTAIWLGAVLVSAEFVWLAFLLWLLAGHLLPLRWGLLLSGFVLVVVIVAPVLQYGSTTNANVLGPIVGCLFSFVISRGYLQLLRDADERERLVATLTQAHADLAQLQDELAVAQRQSGAIAERTRISRDIHDTIAQALSSIRLLAHAQAGRTDDAAAARTLTQVEDIAGASLVDVRRIVAALAPAELDDDALPAALRRMLDRAHDETGIRTELHVDDSLCALPTAVEVALLRTAQSALANVRRHSGAMRVDMSLVDADDYVRLDITDDGSGFDVSAWERATDATSSTYGLRFMRARLRELGGGLDIESAEGDGTTVSAYLPTAYLPTAARS